MLNNNLHSVCLRTVCLLFMLLGSPAHGVGTRYSIPAPYEPASTTSPRSPEWKVASAFGPRDFKKSPFHAGIDFSQSGGDGDVGILVKSLTTGTIENIERDPAAYYISIRSLEGALQYLHIFHDSQFGDDITENHKNVKLSSGYNQVTLGKISKFLDALGLQFTSITCNAIYFYSADVLSKVLTTTHCAGVKINFNGKTVIARSTVNAGEFIAPLGTSGGFNGNAHLHIGLNYRQDNPLVLIEHTNSPFLISNATTQFSVKLATEAGDITEYDQDSISKMSTPGFSIKVTENALIPDLDKAIVTLPDGQTESFSFGGKLTEQIINVDKNINILSDLNLEVGIGKPAIKPVDWRGSGMPRTMYFFVPYPKLKDLPGGDYTLNVQIETVTGVSSLFPLAFKVKKDPPPPDIVGTWNAQLFNGNPLPYTRTNTWGEPFTMTEYTITLSNETANEGTQKGSFCDTQIFSDSIYNNNSCSENYHYQYTYNNLTPFHQIITLKSLDGDIPLHSLYLDWIGDHWEMNWDWMSVSATKQ